MKAMGLKAQLTVLALLAVPLAATGAQQSPMTGADTLRLGVLQQSAAANDPRQRQFELLARQSELRLRNLGAERLPSFSAEATAQYQSDVFKAPSTGITGIQFPTPDKDSYDSRLNVEQSIFNPTIAPRQRVERAQLAESNAQVRTALFGLRRDVNDAFFTAAELDEQAGVIAVTITDLANRLQEAMVRVREGAALPSDTSAIQATLLQRRQDQVEIAANRHAAFARLAELIGRPVPDADRLALPDLSSETSEARTNLATLKARPEFEEFARARERLTRQEDVAAAALKPQLSAFGRVGYGRPGLNAISNDFDAYYVAGLQVRFTPFNWGSTGRERQALALQRDFVSADEAAFASSLTRDIQNDLATIDRLDTTLVMDDAIVLLRERVEAETLLRFQEGVVTASEYLDRSTDVLEARLARAAHRVEQAQARAHLLTTLGLEIK